MQSVVTFYHVSNANLGSVFCMETWPLNKWVMNQWMVCKVDGQWEAFALLVSFRCRLYGMGYRACEHLLPDKKD